MKKLLRRAPHKFLLSPSSKNIGYYFDSKDYCRYLTAADIQHTDGKLRVLRVYRCAERFYRRRCGWAIQFLSEDKDLAKFLSRVKK